MASFDYDVLIIGPGFGGSVAALRAAEKGYRVGVLESGRHWRDEDIPKTQWDLPGFLWFPAAELCGIQRIEYLDVLVLCGAGVGGGSHVHGNTLYVPPRGSSTRRSGPASPTGPASWPRISTRPVGCSVWSDIPTCPPTWTGLRWACTPGVEADDPYCGGAGPRRTGCISCGNCNNGCGHNAKNKLTTNYLYLTEQAGAQVHELTEMYELEPLDGSGFEVRTRHPGWAQRSANLHHRTFTAQQVIVAARLRLSQAPAPHAARRPPDRAVEPARAARPDQLRAAPGGHQDLWAVGPKTGEDPAGARIGVDHLRCLA